MARGRFITFEGGEGSGKSTQLRRLAESLAGRGLEVVITREPGGSKGAEEIRRLLVTGAAERWDPLTEALLNYAARQDHIRQTIAPALAKGQWVLCDRFADSTAVYQGCAQGLDVGVIAKLREFVVGDLEPDLTLVMDLPVKLGLARAKGRRDGEDRYENMDVEFHERLRQGYGKLVEQAPRRCVLIDASGSLDEVGAAVLAEVDARLKEAAA